MNKYFKSFGGGIIWGLKHPFKDVVKTDRYDNMTLTETMCDSLGVGVVQLCVGYGILIGGLIAIGYAGNKLQNKPVKVNMVIDKDQTK